MATTRGRAKARKAQEALPEEERLRRADEEHLRKLRRIRRARAAKGLTLALLAVLFITFVSQNSRPVDVRFLSWTWSVGLIWVFVMAAGLGAVAGFLLGRPGKQLRLHEPPEEPEEPSTSE
jgi:uncharacterized integral membrane protein